MRLGADAIAGLAARGGAVLAAELQLALEAKALAGTLELLAAERKAAREAEAAAAQAAEQAAQQAGRPERQRKAAKGKGK